MRQPFTFYVQADDSRSVSVPVEVKPLPRLKGSTFHIAPPAYTGLKPYEQPGPPESLAVPAGSMVKVDAAKPTEGATKLQWRSGDAAAARTEPMTATAGAWQLDRLVNESSSYEVLVALPTGGAPRVLAQGELTATPDHTARGRFRHAGPQPRGQSRRRGHGHDQSQRPITAVASLALLLAASDDPATSRVIKAWHYLGPPGSQQPAPETFTVALDPDVFTPGSTFLLTARAADFSPSGQTTTSRPIVLRVAGLQDMAVPQGDVLEKLFELLRATIVAADAGQRPNRQPRAARGGSTRRAGCPEAHRGHVRRANPGPGPPADRRWRRRTPTPKARSTPPACRRSCRAKWTWP